jgi:hypothetical protein
VKSFSDNEIADRLRKRWNFVPFRYNPGHGLISLLQIFSTPFMTVQIHYIDTPDLSGMYHDHPWHFVSFMLSGGYTETIWRDPKSMGSRVTKQRKRFSLHFMSHRWGHNISQCDGTAKTLFVSGPWVRNGFRFYAEGMEKDISKYVETSNDGYNILKMR